MKLEFTTRLAGTRQQYYTLRVTRGDQVIAVHTSKSSSYLYKIAQRYK